MTIVPLPLTIEVRQTRIAGRIQPLRKIRSGAVINLFPSILLQPGEPTPRDRVVVRGTETQRGIGGTGRARGFPGIAFAHSLFGTRRQPVNRASD